MSTLKQAGCDYDAAVLPEGAHEIQRRETRRGFYSGAWAALQQIRGIVHDRTKTGAEIKALFEQLEAECREFKDKVTRGDA